MPTHPCTSCHRELERCAEFGCILQKFKLAFFFSFLSDFVTNSTRYAPFISVFGCVDHHSNFKYFSFLLVLALSLNIRVYAADVLYLNFGSTHSMHSASRVYFYTFIFCFKGQYNEIFDLQFFSSFEPA